MNKSKSSVSFAYALLYTLVFAAVLSNTAHASEDNRYICEGILRDNNGVLIQGNSPSENQAACMRMMAQIDAHEAAKRQEAVERAARILELEYRIRRQEEQAVEQATYRRPIYQAPAPRQSLNCTSRRSMMGNTTYTNCY